MNEQQQLMDAIFNKVIKPNEASDFDSRGLAIYQRNLKANAINALQISFPTVIKLIGDDVFSYAAQQLLKQDPPTAGDWGLWGENFPELLRDLTALQDFAYVADVARLDFSMHLLGREKDVELDMNSISFLGDCELDQLRVVLNPSIKLFVSEFPIIDIYCANHGLASQVDQYLNLVAGLGQAALLYRPEFKPLVRSVDSSEYAWLRLMQQGVSIGSALDNLVDNKYEFSLEAWLPLAINQNLISHLEKI
ncbi:MAG: DNA-binding domain-containing protein [Oleispira sp.]